MGRFLRNKRLRSALWIAADGKCQRCGRPLPDDWHADHEIPWSVRPITNVHEMQALCPECNLKKGATVSGLFDQRGQKFEYRKDRMRPGQLQAVETICERVLRCQKFTTIVIPTRYGKTDVMRVSALRLWYENISGPSLILTPGVILRDQVIADDKVRQMLTRYEITNQFKFSPVRSSPLRFTDNGEQIASMTMQLAENNRELLADWVRHELNKGKTPNVFIDECHTGSEANCFGEVALELADAGACCILLTATPNRSDGKPPVGFASEILDSESTKVWIADRTKKAPDGKIWVDLFEGVRQKVRLIPDFEVTFRDAWDESPSPLCKISRIPFDVNLEEVDEDGDGEKCMLSELAPHRVRAELGKIVRHPLVVKTAAEHVVRELTAFRRFYPEAAAIIFCGNDRADDKTANKHAKAIEQAILDIDPDLITVIDTASSDDDESAKKGMSRLSKFAKGHGDILIVKQRASLGLDVLRLKVGCDLSSVRTVASMIQRMTRIATVGERLHHAIQITPDDIISRAIFESMIKNQGGEAVTTELELKDSYLKDKEDKPDKPSYVVDSTGMSDFSDTERNTSKADRYPVVHAILEAYPMLSAMMSHSEVEMRASAFGIECKPVVQTQMVNTDEERTTLIGEINDDAKAITLHRIGGQYDRETYGPTIQQVHNEIKELAGCLEESIDQNSGTKDLEILRRIRKAAARLRKRELG